MPSSRPLRVGIVGARGIGKHHAKWFAQAGCEVAAVYGTTEPSAAAAAAALRELFDFQGQPYHDWDRFCHETDLDACSVCSPAENHFENVRDLAACGIHVLCEKPLVWNWDYTPLRIIEEATALVEAAAHHDILLGVNAQYPAVLEGWRELNRRILGGEPDFSRLSFVMETKGKPRSPHGPAEVWVDLGPHPLALLDRLTPGTVDWTTLRHQDAPNEAILDFDWISQDRPMSVHIECRRVEGPEVHRRLGNQDLTFDFGGRNVDGEFCAVLKAQTEAGEEWIGNDFMRVSVERFVTAVQTGDARQLLIDGQAGLRHLEVLTRVWEHCWPNTTSPAC